MNRRILAVLLALLLAVRPVNALAAGAQTVHETDQGGSAPSALGLDATAGLAGGSGPEVDAEAVFLYERRTDVLIYEKNADVRREPASLTKLMTCLLALEYGDPEESVVVTERALETMDPSGSSAALRAGETYTLEQLLYCLMVESANDAALVIAEYIGGSQEGFVERMNEKAAELGCSNTHFVNPHGMHDEDHYTTARDLAKIMQADLEYSLFRTLYSTETYFLPAMNGRPERKLETTNYLLSAAVNADYYDSRVVGGKTGFTTPAGRCVACAAIDNSLEDAQYAYLAVVLGAPGHDSAGNTAYGAFTAASKLFDFCFGRFDTETVPAQESPVTAPVKNGDGDAELWALEPITALLPLDYDPALLTEEPEWEEPLSAPLEEGQEAGSLRLIYDGICVGKTPLYVAEPVAYQEPPPLPEAKRSRPAGRIGFPMCNPWNRIACVY